MINECAATVLHGHPLHRRTAVMEMCPESMWHGSLKPSPVQVQSYKSSFVENPEEEIINGSKWIVAELIDYY